MQEFKNQLEIKSGLIFVIYNKERRAVVIIQIKVKVRQETLREFGEKLISGKLDRSAIISETYCEKSKPSIGISYWEVENMGEFEAKFSLWKNYYEEIEIKEVVTAKEAMVLLFG